MEAGWNGQGQAESSTEDERPFHVVLRGYDRLEVDARLEYLGSQLVAASQSLQEAQERNAELTDQLRSAQGQPHQPNDLVMPQESFGIRVEKILRLAEDEANAVRAQAAAEAMELVEQARAQAQAMRDEAERLLATSRQESQQLRTAAQQEAEQLRTAAEHDSEQLRVTVRHETDQLRMTALREAQELRATVEQETEQRRTTAAEEFDELRTTTARETKELRSAAQQDAERIRADAESSAKALLASADKIAMDEREHAEQEMQRLSALHDEVWADLTRIKDMLSSVLTKNGPDAATEVGAPNA